MEKNLNFFEETQYFPKWVLLIVMPVSILLLSIFGMAVYQQFYRGQPFGDRPMSDGVLMFSTFFAGLLGIGLPVLLRLNVKVNSKHLLVSFLPLQRKLIQMADITKWEPTAYDPLQEFGGWGIKYSWKNKTWAYTMSGDRGVRLTLKDGSRLLIGSQRPEELSTAIKRAKIK